MHYIPGQPFQQKLAYIRLLVTSRLPPVPPPPHIAAAIAESEARRAVPPCHADPDTKPPATMRQIWPRDVLRKIRHVRVPRTPVTLEYIRPEDVSEPRPR